MLPVTCQLLFGEYSWPDTLVSDNGSYDTGIEFWQVMDDMDI